MLSSPPPTHVAYSDESNYLKGRFRAVALVTLEYADAARIRESLSAVLSPNVREVKWGGVRGHRDRILVEEFLRPVLEHVRNRDLRVDVLSWDSTDPSQNARRHDALTKLEVMYYHAVRTTFGRKWPHGATWEFSPDEHTGINWALMQELANLDGFSGDVIMDDGRIRFISREKFTISGVTQVNSHQEPFVQVADLFAGMCAFSRQHAEKLWAPGFEDWATSELPGFERSATPSELEKIRLIHSFRKLALSYDLDDPLRAEGLRTGPDPCLNFWHWRVPSRSLQQLRLRLA